MSPRVIPAIVAEDRAMDLSIPRDVLAAEGFREVTIDGSTATFAQAEGCAVGEQIAYMAHAQAASYQRRRVVVCCGLATACTVRWPQ